MAESRALGAEPLDSATIQRMARAAGIAMLLSIVFGAVGEAYIPGRIIAGSDAAASAANVVQHGGLFRVGFAAYLVEGICDIALCVLFYVLLRPVSNVLALLSAFFGMGSMITYAVAESFYYAPSLVLHDAPYLAAFTVEQRQALALLSFKMFTLVSTLFVALYGIASMLRGYLIARSGYLPKAIGVLLVIGGAGFFLRTVTFVLAPQFSSAYLLAPMAIAGASLTAWLLIKGADLHLGGVRD